MKMAEAAKSISEEEIIDKPKTDFIPNRINNHVILGCE